MSLLSHAQDAYTLSPKEEQTIADTIVKAYLVAKTAAYRKAGRTAHAKGTATWYPSDKEVKQAQAWAEKQASGIAETYHGMLAHTLEKTLHEKGEREKGWQDIFDSLGEAIDGLVETVKDWFVGLMGWKPDQVADYTCGSGADGGLDAFIVDLQAGEFIDSSTGEAVQIGDFAIAVLPDGAQCADCQEWAGGVYDLAEDVPSFPIHNSCGHSRELVMV